MLVEGHSELRDQVIKTGISSEIFLSKIFFIKISLQNSSNNFLTVFASGGVKGLIAHA